MSELQPYQQRVKDEHDALVEKISALSLFLTHGTVPIDDAELDRMIRQLAAMHTYSFCLSERMEAWNV